MSEALVLLILVWAVLLVPSAVRSRKGSPHATVGGFERAMNVLRTDMGSPASRQLFVPGDAGRIVDHEPPGSSVNGVPGNGAAKAAAPRPAPRAEHPVTARRRVRFVRMLIATGLIGVVAVVFGGWTWPVFLAMLAAVAGYTALLRRLKLQRDEARRVVAELDLRRDPLPEPAGIAAGEGWSSGVRLRRWDD